MCLSLNVLCEAAVFESIGRLSVAIIWPGITIEQLYLTSIQRNVPLYFIVAQLNYRTALSYLGMYHYTSQWPSITIEQLYLTSKGVYYYTSQWPSITIEQLYLT